MEARHHLTFEVGRLTLEEYLNLVVFFKKRSFTRNQFRQFMFAQSKPFPEMIYLVIQLKQHLGLKIVIVSNESREMNAFRSSKFGPDKLSDCFVSSSFVHMRKPDVEIFQLALDLAQVRPKMQSLLTIHDVHSDCRERGNSGHSSHRLQIYTRHAVPSRPECRMNRGKYGSLCLGSALCI